MAAAPTFHSRLRVLVAKAFRACQLYSSMRSGRLDGKVSLADLSNDVRAKEWLAAHSELQSGLNEALDQANPTLTISKVRELKRQFEKTCSDAEHALKTGTERAIESMARHEFSTSFKSSLDLVRIKARQQASKVVCDELESLLGVHDSKLSDTTSAGESAAKEAPEAQASNVIPLRRRAQ